jgi:hypothetical protein
MKLSRLSALARSKRNFRGEGTDMMVWGMMIVGSLAALMGLDRLLGFAIRAMEPMLPNEIAGPDGWFVDTRKHGGVFDRRQF